MTRPPDDRMRVVIGRYVEEVARRQHSILVASREDHVVRRIVEVDPISHGALDVHIDDGVVVATDTWDRSSSPASRRREVDVLADVLVAAPATWHSPRTETVYDDRGDVGARGAVDAARWPTPPNFHLGQRGVVVDLDSS